MSCFSCFSSQEKKAARRINSSRRNHTLPGATPHKEATAPQARSDNLRPRPSADATYNRDANKESGGNNIAAQTFTFRELATATKNFRQECLIGEGGFGRVYKGKLEKTGQVVAVKQLDRNGLQGNKEFLVEVLMLSLPTHEQQLVAWAQPVFKDPSSFSSLADPHLRGNFPKRGLNQAVAIAAMCLQEEPAVRPLISDVVSALSFLGSGPTDAATINMSLNEDQNLIMDQEKDQTQIDRQRAVQEAIQWGSDSRHIQSHSASVSSL
ncbi:hypothetical protein EZV62_018079 [Acer yangbiense]|uniref:Protein kinase domain-containing protein n=1 Tax=Acer yangbiense TaxID=1000413 RepID=A0A5C7HKJ5_9ROSI|nr:hypothetical protein EZV62_018079 [Acer yangbiense]